MKEEKGTQLINSPESNQRNLRIAHTTKVRHAHGICQLIRRSVISQKRVPCTLEVGELFCRGKNVSFLFRLLRNSMKYEYRYVLFASFKPPVWPPTLC